MYKSIDFISSIFKSTNSINLKNWETEFFNEEYESCTFQANNQNCRSRIAKKTPNKQGYFVVFWTKDNNNKNRPFTYNESCDKLIITVIDGSHKGLFIFPRDVLAKHNIIANGAKKGKMAMRLYPTWEHKLNQTAIKTQRWQSNYFIELTDNIDKPLLYKLLN
ncbi:MepB family protein [Staphylococcus pseudoxylosus]|uniref:MepB family protein n=1 Tax=Staphylococcus pseudoxylosus TaxID=2282419 RepID=UPI000D1D96A8|nr:MepB family protein [Staphylococcus pseudoxylosus]PTI55429.1 MepB protein [Staphylococcus xylosus]MDW8799333.1 MepB family protein [Staphylococcus pseudoxylosus]MEB6037437.1 MepB family protein [Staphylococcus pseudoxylosus]MEB7764078.1 MepB family protein [Staphylococcus pseudoxylosus]MEB8087384.1 MepB family protein [Staphylococcus pseudoxylosus]